MPPCARPCATTSPDSVEWLTLLPEIVGDTMVRRLMGRKHPISEEIDAPSLYRDHAEWHMRLLPKVKKLVLALAGADRLDTSAPDGFGVPAGTAALAIPRAVRSARPPRPEAPGQMRLGDERG